MILHRWPSLVLETSGCFEKGARAIENLLLEVFRLLIALFYLSQTSTKASEAANALKLTGEHLLKFGIVDEVIPEPQGGAHRDPEAVATQLRKFILRNIKDITALSLKELLDQRYEKFRRIGHVVEAAA